MRRGELIMNSIIVSIGSMSCKKIIQQNDFCCNHNKIELSSNYKVRKPNDSDVAAVEGQQRTRVA